MNRRAFVLGATSALSGCTSMFPRDRRYPAPYFKPQLLFEWTWKPDAGELVIEVVAGNPLTAENTARVILNGYGIDEPVVWASNAGDGREDFPVEPGDSLTVEAEPHGSVRVVWRDSVGNGMNLDTFKFADGTRATAGESG